MPFKSPNTKPLPGAGGHSRFVYRPASTWQVAVAHYELEGWVRLWGEQADEPLTWSWAAQPSQHTVWPQGQKVELISSSQHSMHSMASFSLRSFSCSTRVCWQLRPSQLLQFMLLSEAFRGELGGLCSLLGTRSTTPALYRALLAWSYTSFDVLLMSKTYFLPRLMFSFRNRDAKWPFKSRLYCIMTALVTVSHLREDWTATLAQTSLPFLRFRPSDIAVTQNIRVSRHSIFLLAFLKVYTSSFMSVKDKAAINVRESECPLHLQGHERQTKQLVARKRTFFFEVLVLC